jgi:hypothetical protein
VAEARRGTLFSALSERDYGIFISSRLKKAVAKLTLDKQTLKKGARGKLLCSTLSNQAA